MEGSQQLAYKTQEETMQEESMVDAVAATGDAVAAAPVLLEEAAAEGAAEEFGGRGGEEEEEVEPYVDAEGPVEASVTAAVPEAALAGGGAEFVEPGEAALAGAAGEAEEDDDEVEIVGTLPPAADAGEEYEVGGLALWVSTI